MSHVLRSIGRVALTTLQYLAAVLSAIGSGGATAPAQPPTRSTKPRDEYRP